jgi:hypothetical protein
VSAHLLKGDKGSLGLGYEVLVGHKQGHVGVVVTALRRQMLSDQNGCFLAKVVAAEPRSEILNIVHDTHRG